MSSFDELWCGDCGNSHEGMCKKHGVLHKVQDAIIPSRARLTLPASLTLKSVKENGSVHTAVFSKRVIPVRSQFGPLDAPIISKTKIEVKPKKETTVWKKKNAMQKSMETSLTQNSDHSDVHQSSNDLHSPIIANVRSLQPKSNNAVGNDVAISSISQQLLSVNNQSINQTGMGDGGLLNLHGGLNQLPLHSSPIHNHTGLNQLQHSLQDLQSIGFPTTPNSIQLTQENLHSLAQQYPSYGHSDFSTVQQHLNFADFVSATPLQHAVGADQSNGNLLLGPPIEADGQSAEDSGVGDTSNVNVSDSTATDATSDTELEDSMEQDMSFEFKVLTGDGFAEVYDNTDEEHSNWMIFVRPATTVKEQNLIAYEEDGQIYFVSLKPIQTNTELKVWYSKDYAKSINKGMLSSEPVNRQFDDNKLQCLQCEVKFSDQEEMENHCCVSKIKARRKGRPRKYVKPTKTWRAKMEKTKVKESQQSVDSKTNIDANINNNANATSTPVKRGRGRPRTKAAIEKNEQVIALDHAVQTPIQHGIQPLQQQKPLQQVHVMPQQQLQHSTEQQQQQFHLEIDNTYHILPDDENDDVEDDSHAIEDQSFNNQADDPLFEEKKLVITEDRPKKKRGPKSSKSPTPCPHCGEAFQAEAAYYLHVYSHTGIKPFICEVEGCERGFLSKFKLERHRLIHTSPRHHKCSYCDKSFNRKDHLKNHMITHDPHKKIWKCELCGKEYSYSFSYRTHMAFHAADRGETLSCGICKKTYENKEQLLFHLKVHTGARAAKNATEKTHQCFECSKKFFTRKDVKRHMITHTKKKDFLCQFCPQRFGRKDHLTRHLRTTHTGDSPLPARRKNTGDSSSSSPQKQKRERQIYTQIEPTMVPLQMAIPTMQPDELQEQLMSSVAAASQAGNLSATPATILQNLQYAISQTPGNHGAARDIQIPAVLYEAAAAASAQQQQEQQQQQAQANQIAAASMNNIQPPPGMPTVQHSNLPMQYQINEKGYVLNNSQPEQTVVRQIQVSPNVEYKHIAQQLQSNMFITAVSNPSNLHHHHQQPQQVQQIQLQQAQPQQHQTMVPVGKIETQAIELTRANGLAAALQQPPEYQIATAQPIANMGQSNATVADQNNQGQLLMANPVDSRQNPHSQTYSTLLSYMETLRFLENLPTNNTSTIPLQQLQALNVDISQGQTAQIIPAVQAAAYNSVSGSNILNLNQAEFKGVVTIQHPHVATAVQLTPQDIKNVVSLAQSVTPVQHVTYQQQS